MKRIGYIYKDITDLENIRVAHKNACKGKRHYLDVKMVEKNPEKYFTEIKKMLENKTFKNSEYKTMRKATHTGKVRKIYKLPYYPDRIIQHAVMQALEPIWERTLIRNTYASIKN